MNLSHRPEDKTAVYGKETMQDSKLRSCCEWRHRLWLPPWQSPGAWVCAEDCSTLLKELSCKRYYYCCYYYIWISGSNIVQWGSSPLQWEHSLITQSHLFPVVWEQEHIRSTSGRPSSSASTKTSIQAEFKPPDAVLFIGHFIAPLRFFPFTRFHFQFLMFFHQTGWKRLRGTCVPNMLHAEPPTGSF